MVTLFCCCFEHKELVLPCVLKANKANFFWNIFFYWGLINFYTFPLSFSSSQRLLPSAFLTALLLEAAQGNLDAVLFGLLCSCSKFWKTCYISTISELRFLCKSQEAKNFASWQSIRRTSSQSGVQQLQITEKSLRTLRDAFPRAWVLPPQPDSQQTF